MERYIVFGFVGLILLIGVIGFLQTEPPAKTKNVVAPELQGSVEENEQIAGKCKRHVKEFCSTFRTAHGTVACLREHLDELSPTCRKLVDAQTISHAIGIRN